MYQNRVHTKGLLSDLSISLTVLYLIGQTNMIQMSHDMTSSEMFLIVSVLLRCLAVLYASDNQHVQLTVDCSMHQHFTCRRYKVMQLFSFNNIMTEHFMLFHIIICFFLIREINYYPIRRVKFYIYNTFIQSGVPMAHDHIVARVAITCAIRYIHGIDGTIVCNTTSCAFRTYHP